MPCDRSSLDQLSDGSRNVSLQGIEWLGSARPQKPHSDLIPPLTHFGPTCAVCCDLDGRSGKKSCHIWMNKLENTKSREPKWRKSFGPKLSHFHSQIGKPIHAQWPAGNHPQPANKLFMSRFFTKYSYHFLSFLRFPSFWPPYWKVKIRKKWNFEKSENSKKVKIWKGEQIWRVRTIRAVFHEGVH